MSKTITSGVVNFMDTTDNRKLDVYITSNLPTVQIKNSNTNPVTYTPNWTSTPLVLGADAYLDSQDVNNKTTFSWYKKNALGVETLIKANSKTITISNNALDDGQIVVYVCKALYKASNADNGIEDIEQITFTQVTAGTNGQDGTSVTILGSYDTLSALLAAHPTGDAGDAYLIGGRLYVWAVDNGEWEDVGNIQGPKGDSGVGIRSVTSTYGVSDASSIQPTSWQPTIPTVADGKYLWTRTIIDYTDDSIPDTVTYIYAKQGTKGDTGTAGSSVTVSSVQYQEGASATVAPTGTWSNSVVTVAEGKYLWTKTTFSDGKTAYGVAKQGVSGRDGVGINSTTVDYGVSDSAAVQPTTWQQSIPVVAEGQYLWTRTVIDYTDTSRADTVTYTYAKQGTKGDAGVAGSSVTVLSIQYQEGSSATTAPTGTWSPVVVAVSDGKYLWTKTAFSDGKVAYGVAKQGSAGTAASLVNITPSALYFKSTTGKDGTFSPDYIYLYPRFQTVTYSSWQYSVDGGATWVNALGANGLTISTYNSVANSLRISKSSALYTDAITSISFRCNSSNSSVYDVVSIAKIYDVVDLQIGSRNLARFTDSEYWSNYGSATTKVSFSEGTRSTRIKAECTITDTSTSAYFGIQQMPQARLMKLQPNQEYTLSFLVRGNVSNINYTYLMNSGSTNIPIRMTNKSSISEIEFTKIVQTFTTTDSVTTSTGSYLMISYLGAKDPTMWFELEEIQLEAGNVATDWSKAPEDLIEEASNVNIMLSNESHLFEATASGVPTETSVILDVVGYKGSILSETTVGTITGLPSAGMAAVVSDNGTTNTKITVSVTSALTSDIADYGVLTIPVTVNGNTINKLFSWLKAKAGEMGAAGGDAVTFQVYSSNGYALSINTPTVTLQTFAYVGDTEITAGATYQWYSYNDGVWRAISGETLGYLDVSREDVSFSNSYMCKMTFDGVEYSGVVTVDDKNDSNAFFSSKPTSYTAGDFWLTAADYTPPGHSVGTLLRAEHTNSTYSDDDWVVGSKYDADILDLKKEIADYNQHFSFDSVNGVKISARSDDGSLSEFSTTLTNERLSFNYGNNAVAYIDATKMNIKEAEIESPLTITGKYSGSTMEQAPIINIGNFSIVVESNGSLSIVANT